MSNAFFYEPFYDLERLIERLNSPHQERKSVAPQSRNTVQNNTAAKTFRPRMNLKEDAEKNIVTASFELPGVQKESIEVDVHNGKLTVSASTHQS